MILRDNEGELIFSGDSFVVTDNFGLSVEVKNCFRELKAEVTNKPAVLFEDCHIFDNDGRVIGDVCHLRFAQDGGLTVRELAEISGQWTVNRIVFQKFPG